MKINTKIKVISALIISLLLLGLTDNLIVTIHAPTINNLVIDY